MKTRKKPQDQRQLIGDSSPGLAREIGLDPGIGSRVYAEFERENLCNPVNLRVSQVSAVCDCPGVLPEDEPMMRHGMPEILNVEQIRSRLKENESYVVYFLPTNYVMQGLIADTGGDWQLYKRQHSIGRFTDWVFHPFTHLGGAHHSIFEPANHSGHSMAAGSVRRLIFLKVSNVVVADPADVFAVSAVRTPDFVVDMDVHGLNILDLKTLPVETAWGRVPTPAF